MLEVGSRSGALFAVSFFGLMLVVLGAAVALALAKRGVGRVPAGLAGLMLFVGPGWLVYASSLGGFYEIEARGAHLVLHYLLTPAVELRTARVAGVEARPAFRGRWRLHITDSNGARYESATADRETVKAAEEALAGR